MVISLSQEMAPPHRKKKKKHHNDGMEPRLFPETPQIIRSDLAVIKLIWSNAQRGFK